MKDFLFAPEQARTPLGKLSGGERGRLMLAQALAKPSNVLVLDEPTNDLDLETLDVLEEMLGDYAGTVLLVSHDRDFLDRLVTRVIVPEGDGRWIEYAGGYTDMLAQRGEDVGAGRSPMDARRDKADAALRRQRPNPPSAGSPSTTSTRSKLCPRRSRHCRRPSTACRKSCTTRTFTGATLRLLTRPRPALAAAQSELAAAEEKWLALEIFARGD